MTLGLRDLAFLTSPTNLLYQRAGAYPSLDLRFAENKSLVDATTGQNLVTFTRASSGTYVDSTGTIRTATTNLLLRSEEFDNASWAKDFTTVTANTGAAPNGTTTADKVAEDSSNNLHAISQYVSGFAASAVATLSIYAKAAGRTRFRIQTDATAGTGTADFDLSAGTATTGTGVFSNGSISNVGAGWYRCSVRCTTSGAGAFGLKVILAQTTYGTAYTGDGTSGLLLWGAQLEQSSTVGEYIPTTSTINSAPRFDHNPTTGESLGLLVEEARTNSIRNNTMVGAVAGTPGTVPTNWTANAATNLTREVVGTGTENGINYIDLRFTGTVTAARIQYIFFEPNTQIAASNGQSWAGSVWLKIAAGSLTNIASVVLQADTQDSSFVYVNTPCNSAVSLTSSFVRYSASGSAVGASVAWINPFVQFTTAASGAIDITLRIGMPQLELGAFATSVIPTSTAAATRSADVASISGSNFSGWYRQDEGTVFCGFARSALIGSSNFANLWAVSDNSANERILVYNTGGSQTMDAVITSGGSAQATLLVAGTITANSLQSYALTYRLNDFAAVRNAGTADVDTSGTLPTVDRLYIGSNHVGGAAFSGTIRRLCYWPARLSNSTLQAITQ